MEDAERKAFNKSETKQAEELGDDQEEVNQVERDENESNREQDREDASGNEEKQSGGINEERQQDSEEEAAKLRISTHQGTKSQFHKSSESNGETNNLNSNKADGYTNQEPVDRFSSPKKPVETISYSKQPEAKNEDVKKESQRYEPTESLPSTGKQLFTAKKTQASTIEPETADSPDDLGARSSAKKPFTTSYYSTWQEDTHLKKSALFSSNGFGIMSDFHSASSLQHSIVSYGFTKANRFTQSPGNPHLASIEIPTCRSARSTTLGFGRKVQMADLKLQSVRDFPSPGKYNLKSSVELMEDKKFTFGIPYSAYAKVHLPGYTQLLPAVAAELPGPGQYEIDRELGGKTKVGFRVKGKMFSELINLDSPACNKYSIRTSSTQNERYKNIGFGFGKRSDFTSNKFQGPGPGTYRMTSAFDKFAGKPWDRKVKKGIEAKEFVIRKI